MLRRTSLVPGSKPQHQAVGSTLLWCTLVSWEHTKRCSPHPHPSSAQCCSSPAPHQQALSRDSEALTCSAGCSPSAQFSCQAGLHCCQRPIEKLEILPFLSLPRSGPRQNVFLCQILTAPCGLASLMEVTRCFMLVSKLA